MSDDHWEPRCRPPRLTSPVPVDPTGLSGPTKGQAAGPRWRRTSRGLYVPADVDPSVPEQRVLEQSRRLPPGGAVSGWAACRLHGGRYFDGRLPRGDGPRPVPLVQGQNGRLGPAPGSVVSREPLFADEVVLHAGVPVTVALRAVFDAGQPGDLHEGRAAGGGGRPARPRSGGRR